MADPRVDAVKALVRDVPDFPKPGILFKDITPMLADARTFGLVVDLLAEAIAARRPEVLVGIESRGFIFAAPVARALGVGFVPIRKPGKLPYHKRRIEYALEYGTDALEMHHDAFLADTRVVIVDDVLATGGTAAAAGQLVEQAGGKLAGYAFAIELTFLSGRARLGGAAVDALISY